jgi:hypothetical protein
MFKYSEDVVCYNCAFELRVLHPRSIVHATSNCFPAAGADARPLHREVASAVAREVEREVARYV